MTLRKQVRRAVVIVVGIGVICGFILLHSPGCSTPPRISGVLSPTEARSQKLTALAAAEAAEIADVDSRITRLLNLAEKQIQRKWTTDARATLAAGRKTLGSEDAKKLNDHARLSGWVSVSELSRQADDEDGAMVACDGAIAALRAIEDPSRRCDYVMGVCNEVQYLKGLPAAAEVLSEAGPWTKAIDDITRRRQAVVSFAAALFNLDDYTRGQQMLREEPDAAWRSDTLLMLASLTTADSAPANAARIASPASVSGESSPPAPYFGKQLNYRDVFQGQMNSQTQRE